MPTAPESSIGHSYRVFYEWLCGRHPETLPWHFQWLPDVLMLRSLDIHLPALTGRVLDVGCGEQPYKGMLRSAQQYVGVDIEDNGQTDVVVESQRWPFADKSFDAVLMNQVMEYLCDPGQTISEIRRVLRPGGRAVISLPFLFNEHGDRDCIRLTAHGSEALFPGFRMIVVEKQGGIGSTSAILWLNWINTTLNRRFWTRLTRPVLLPVWLPFCLLANLLGLLLDRLDRTGCFYSNLLIVLERGDG